MRASSTSTHPPCLAVRLLRTPDEAWSLGMVADFLRLFALTALNRETVERHRIQEDARQRFRLYAMALAVALQNIRLSAVRQWEIGCKRPHRWSTVGQTNGPKQGFHQGLYQGYRRIACQSPSGFVCAKDGSTVGQQSKMT